MEWKRQKIYFIYLWQQLNFAAFTFQELETASFEGDPDEMTRRAHAFLVHAAFASRVLWPGPSGKKESVRRRTERAETLRSTLGLGAKHPLRSRALRNLFEHYDDELDERIAAIEAIAPEPIVWQETGGFPEGSPPPAWVLRSYDPRNKVMIVFGQRFDLLALRAAVQEVGDALHRLFVDRYLAGGGDPANVGGPFPSYR